MKKFDEKSAARYEQHYTDEGFWRKLSALATSVGRKVLYPALQLYYLMQSPTVPTKAKTMIVGALGYLILPTDLVPDFLPAIGLTDDLTAIMLVLRTVRQYLTPNISQQALQTTNRLIKQPPTEHEKKGCA